ncbi:1-acyl-sn-glycerol-3-phosphate acyltransferase [bacterium]|nr:1-acyl-sn-glycerol-3-phosphate acyltransferase [bacterium]
MNQSASDKPSLRSPYGDAPQMRMVYRHGSALLRLISKLLFRLKIVGRERVPHEGRLVLACNHLSHLDPPLVGISIPREVHYAAKIGIFRGLWSHFFRWVNAVPVRRRGSDKQAVRVLLEALHHEHAILIFPEGTNSKDGKPLPAKPGVGLLAMKTGSRILPVRIEGTPTGAWKWTAMLKLIVHRKGNGVTIRFGDPYDPSPIAAKAGSDREAYRAIAQDVMGRIEQLGGTTNGTNREAS